MHLYPVTPFDIVHRIKMGHLAGVHLGEGVVRRQSIIIACGRVVGRLRPMILFAFVFLGMSAFVGGGVICLFV
jgi:hypothetical protein